MTTPGGQLTPGDDTTPPVYGVPDGAFVGDAGSPNAVQQLSHMTEASAKQAMKTPVAPSFAAQRDGVWGLMDRVAAAITGRTPEGDPLEYVENWLGEERANTGQVISDYGDALKDKVSSWAVPTVSPLSQAINRRADPTFQLSDFMVPNSSVGLSGRTNSANGPEGHSHNLGSAATATNSWSIPSGADAKGRTYFAFLTPAINRAYEQLNFMVSAVTSPACRMDVAIYVVNDEDRTLIRQVLVEDAAAALGFAEAVVTVTFDQWVATQGSYIAVVWLQHGTGNTRRILGLDDTPRPLSNAIFPRKISAIHPSTGMTSLPTTLSGDTQVDFESLWFTPYAELSESVGLELRYFQDPFTSDTHQWIARPWVGLTDQRVSVSNAGWAGVPVAVIVNYGARAVIYETPLSTDRVQVSARVLGNFSGSGDGAAYSFVALRTTNNMGIGVGVFYNAHTIQIRSWASGSAELIYDLSTVRASTSWTLGSAREFTATWEAGEVAVYDETNTAILSWTDTVTQPVARYRFTGMGFQRLSDSFSPRLDHWGARDLPPVELEEAPAAP